MASPRVRSRVREYRERKALSQAQLAEQVGVTRQALIAVEAGRQGPSAALALRLARALGCSVENLFALVGPDGAREVRVPLDADIRPGDRVQLGQVAGRWVAHPVPGDGSTAADGTVLSVGPGPRAEVQPFEATAPLDDTVWVAGCAPLIGGLGERARRRFADVRVCWVPATSAKALALLREGVVHVAGIHLESASDPGAHARSVSARFPGERMLLVNLTCWLQGALLEPGNPRGIRSPADLARPGLRFARREPGAGARALLEEVGIAPDRLEGPIARGHADVARLVRCGAADAGVAIESAAHAEGLEFLPLRRERFDLVVPGDLAEAPAVARVLETVDDAAFREDLRHLAGYEGELAGHVVTLDG